MYDSPPSEPIIVSRLIDQSSAMDAGADINTFLLSLLCCVERMAVERHECSGQETQNVGGLFEQYFILVQELDMMVIVANNTFSQVVPFFCQ